MPGDPEENPGYRSRWPRCHRADRRARPAVCGSPSRGSDHQLLVILDNGYHHNSSVKSPMVYGIDVDGGTIDHRKSAVLALEGEEQVRSTEEDGLDT